MSRHTLALVVLILPLTEQSALACEKARTRWFLGQDTSALWTVKPGETCEHAISVNNGASAIHEIKVTARARSGVAGTNGHSNYAYQAAANYTGPDHFEVTISGERNGSKAKTTIKVDVDVRR